MKFALLIKYVYDSGEKSVKIRTPSVENNSRLEGPVAVNIPEVGGLNSPISFMHVYCFKLCCSLYFCNISASARISNHC